jgi:hypothetical protein
MQHPLEMQQDTAWPQRKQRRYDCRVAMGMKTTNLSRKFNRDPDTESSLLGA